MPDEPTVDDTSPDTPDAPDDTSTDAPADDTPAPSTDSTPDDAEKWKALSRKHEKAAKAAQAELDKIRKANLSDTEKAIEEARDAGKAEARAEAAALIAAAELKAAGVPAEDVAFIDLAKFIGDDGQIDSDAIAQAGKRFSARQAAPSSGSADAGPQGAPKPGQLDRAALASMTPDQIVEAKAKGQLNDLLGIKT